MKNNYGHTKKSKIKSKVCTKCHSRKYIIKFSKRLNGKYGVNSQCKKCVSKNTMEYFKDRPEQRKLNQRNYYKNNRKKLLLKSAKFRKLKKPLQDKLYAILYKYRLSKETYFKVLRKQNNKCKICKNKVKKVVIDHCHSTNKVRGILCRYCNNGLGFFKDNKNSLSCAIKYLEDFENGKVNIRQEQRKKNRRNRSFK